MLTTRNATPEDTAFILATQALPAVQAYVCT